LTEVRGEDGFQELDHSLTAITREIGVLDLNKEARNNVWDSPLIPLIQVSLLLCL
jgi:hypothetical protein